MAAKDPARRRAAASIGSLASWGRTVDRTARTAPARNAFFRSFLDKADPDGVMTPEARQKAAEALYRKHFKQMRLRSGESKRRKRAA